MNNDFDLGIVYSSAGTLAADMGQIIEQSQRAIYRSVKIKQKHYYTGEKNVRIGRSAA